MHSDSHQGLVDVGNPRVHGHPRGELPAGEVDQRRVEPAEALESRAVQEEGAGLADAVDLGALDHVRGEARGVDARRAAKHPGQRVPREEGLVSMPQRGRDPALEVDRPPGHHEQLAGAGRRQHAGQALGLEAVILEQRLDPGPARELHAAVPVGHEAEITFVDVDAHAGEAPRVVPGQRGGVVARAIVHHEDLEVRAGLGQGAVEALAQEAGPVVRGHTDAHERCPCRRAGRPGLHHAREEQGGCQARTSAAASSYAASSHRR